MYNKSFEKKQNSILKDNETHKNIADEILKSDTDCYTKYVNNFCHNRVLNKKRNLLFAFILHV